MGTVSLPLGPATSNCSPICTFTPPGSGISFFPIRDIESFLPHPAQNLAANVLFVGISASHHSARGRQDVDAHAAEHARNFRLAHIYAATGARYSLDR